VMGKQNEPRDEAAKDDGIGIPIQTVVCDTQWAAGGWADPRLATHHGNHGVKAHSKGSLHHGPADGNRSSLNCRKETFKACPLVRLPNLFSSAAPVSDDNLLEWKGTMIGPANTPYKVQLDLTSHSIGYKLTSRAANSTSNSRSPSPTPLLPPGSNFSQQSTTQILTTKEQSVSPSSKKANGNRPPASSPSLRASWDY
jgi:hypothetical protein